MAKNDDLPGRPAVPETGRRSRLGHQGRRCDQQLAGTETLSTIVSTINEMYTGLKKLDKAIAHHGDGDAVRPRQAHEGAVLPAMLETRVAADKLETMVSDDLWPLPTYREMLFIK